MTVFLRMQFFPCEVLRVAKQITLISLPSALVIQISTGSAMCNLFHILNCATSIKISINSLVFIYMLMHSS